MKIIVNFVKRYSYIFVAIALIALYEIATENNWLSNILFPTIERMAELFPQYGQELLTNVLSSFGLLIPSLIWAAVLGIGLGIPMGLRKGLHHTLNPIFNAISPLPATLLTPYAIHISGSFRSASIFIIAFGSFWPIFNATMNGVMTIDKRYLDNAATLAVTPLRKMLHIILPAAAPSIFSGSITAMRISFILLVVAEMYGVSSGMGYFVQRYSTMGSFDQVAIGFIVLSIALVAFLAIFDVIKKRVLHWTLN